MLAALAVLSSAVPVAVHAAPLVGTGSPISRGNMPAFCRGEASAEYGVRPMYIKTAAIRKVPGGYEIDGTADLGTKGAKAFTCRFDSARKFVDVKAATGR